jgi:hypothetical protein
MFAELFIVFLFAFSTNLFDDVIYGKEFKEAGVAKIAKQFSNHLHGRHGGGGEAKDNWSDQTWDFMLGFTGVSAS